MGINAIRPNVPVSGQRQVQGLEQELARLEMEKKKAADAGDREKTERLEKKIQQIKEKIEQLKRQEKTEENTERKPPSEGTFDLYA